MQIGILWIVLLGLKAKINKFDEMTENRNSVQLHLVKNRI